MRKHVKLVLCGLAVAMLAAGCSKKDDTAKETTATESDSSASTETEAEITDKGEVTKLGNYKGVEVKRESPKLLMRKWIRRFRVSSMQIRSMWRSPIVRHKTAIPLTSTMWE